MAGEEAALNLLGGLLALPLSIPQQRAQQQQQAQVQQALSQPGAITQSGGLSPDAMRAVIQGMQPAPYKPAGSDVPGIGPVLGGLSSGVGTAGRVLQTLAGGGPAPRPNDFLDAIKGISSMQRDAANEDFRRNEAAATRDYRERTFAERVAHDRATEKASDQRINISLDRAEHAGEGGAPSVERDLDEMARAKFPNDRAQQLQWKQDERLRLAGQKASVATDAAVERQKQVQRVKDFALTNTTKTMIERAPTVIYQTNKVLHLLDQVRTGPLVGRWQEMMTTEAGLRNPEYRKLRTDLGLLISSITQMHVGSRAVAQIAEQFAKTIGETSQDPDNLRASLGEILDYAQEVQGRRGTPPPPAHDDGSGATGPQTGPQTHDLGDGWSVDIH